MSLAIIVQLTEAQAAAVKGPAEQFSRHSRCPLKGQTLSFPTHRRACDFQRCLAMKGALGASHERSRKALVRKLFDAIWAREHPQVEATTGSKAEGK